MYKCFCVTAVKSCPVFLIGIPETRSNSKQVAHSSSLMVLWSYHVHPLSWDSQDRGKRWGPLLSPRKQHDIVSSDSPRSSTFSQPWLGKNKNLSQQNASSLTMHIEAKQIIAIVTAIVGIWPVSSAGVSQDNLFLRLASANFLLFCTPVPDHSHKPCAAPNVSSAQSMLLLFSSCHG